MDRNFLAGRAGDAANAVLAAVGYNFSLLLRWFAMLLWAWIKALAEVSSPQTQPVAGV